MKLLVFGTSEFAVPTLEALARDHEIVGVVTQPDRPAGRGHKLASTPVKRAAERLGLQVFTPEKLRPFVEEARALAPDAFVVISYGRIIPQAVLDVVPIAYNVHPSLLPLYRGATPIQSAIRDGRTETAITIIAMDAGMDTGDVLLQQRYPIGTEETYGELHDRLARESIPLVAYALTLHPDRFNRRPQTQVARELGITDDEISRTLTHPLRKEDLVIDWAQTGRRIVDQIRSLAPQPLARTVDGVGEQLKIVRAHVSSSLELGREFGGTFSYASGPGLQAGGSPGRYRLYAVARDGAEVVVVDRLIAANRGEMSGEAYAQSVVARMQSRLGWQL